jgi:hypothetical protein
LDHGLGEAGMSSRLPFSARVEVDGEGARHFLLRYLHTSKPQPQTDIEVREQLPAVVRCFCRVRRWLCGGGASEASGAASLGCEVADERREQLLVSYRERAERKQEECRVPSEHILRGSKRSGQ